MHGYVRSIYLTLSLCVTKNSESNKSGCDLDLIVMILKIAHADFRGRSNPDYVGRVKLQLRAGCRTRQEGIAGAYRRVQCRCRNVTGIATPYRHITINEADASHASPWSRVSSSLRRRSRLSRATLFSHILCPCRRPCEQERHCEVYRFHTNLHCYATLMAFRNPNNNCHIINSLEVRMELGSVAENHHVGRTAPPRLLY